MTTEFDPTTAPGTAGTPGLDDAVEAARRAGSGGPLDDFIERIAERVGAKASVHAVFGDPVERDGITVIPVAKVRWAFGGGSGRGPVPGAVDDPMAPRASFDDLDDAEASDRMGMGAGGGGGVTADPIGYLEIGPDGASFNPITPARPSPAFLLAAGVTATLLLRGLARLVRR